MPIPVRTLRAALESKFGFEQVQSGHERFRFYIDGKLAAHTEVSRSWREVANHMVPVIAGQLHVTSSQLREMIDCTIGPDAYRDLLLAETPAPRLSLVGRKKKHRNERGLTDSARSSFRWRQTQKVPRSHRPDSEVIPAGVVGSGAAPSEAGAI